MNKNFFNLLSISVLSGVLAMGCGSSSTTEEGTVKIDPKKLDGTGQIKIGGKIFSIPSPFQTADLIKGSGAPFNSAMLNQASNSANYATNFHKALNLGIYGADLGYLTIYEKTDDAPSYITSVQKLSDELGMGGAFSSTLIDRFTNNLENKDSLLVLVSDAYRAGDEYLKNNDKNDVASLILAGGWIEALYFSTNTGGTNNQAVMNRIGEQKTTLSNLIELIESFGNDESYSSLAEELKDLYRNFENVQFTYTFNKPETDDAKMLTTIKSTTSVSISEADLKAIAEKVKDIRTKIVEASL